MACPEAKRVVEKAHERGDFPLLECGYRFFWIPNRGAASASDLRARLAKPEMPECVRVDKSSKTGWSVGDIIRCRHHSGSWRVWRVYGVFLGAVNQESVIELECLDRNANSQGWACVPEDLLDLLMQLLTDPTPITEAGLRELGFERYFGSCVWWLGDLRFTYEDDTLRFDRREIKTIGRLRMLLLSVWES